MSDYLVKAVFKILGGGSMGYNRGKIATRAAEQREKELARTQAFTAGESEKERDFQIKMAAINQNYTRMNNLQNQIYAEKNLGIKNEFEKELKQLDLKNNILLKELDQGFTVSEREAGQTFTTSEREAGQTFTTSEREEGQIFTADENELNRLNQLELKRMGIEGNKQVEILKDSLNKVNNTQGYYIGGNRDVTVDQEIVVFGSESQRQKQKDQALSQRGRQYITFNISDKDTEDEKVQKKYDTWVNESPRLTGVMKGLLEQGRTDDFKKIMDDLNMDLFKYKKYLVRKNGININTSGQEDKAKALDIGIISNFLSRWDDGDENTITYKDVVREYVKGMWFNNEALSDAATDALFDAATKSLEVNMEDKRTIVPEKATESGTHPIYYAVAEDLGLGHKRLFRDSLDNNNVQRPVFKRKSSKPKVELMAALLFNHNDSLRDQIMEGSDSGEVPLNIGIKPSAHYSNGYLSSAEKLAVDYVLRDSGGIYNTENIETLHDALTILMPEYNENNAPWDYQKYITAIGLDGKDIAAKVASGQQAISTIKEVIDLYDNNDNMASGRVGLFTTKIFELTLFRESGSFFNVATQWLKGAGFSLINDGEEDSMTNLLGKRLAKADDLLNKARTSDGKGVDLNKLSKPEKELLDTHTKEAYMALLAYQVAAAIQGGTGGRTISDQDVANIRKALGEQFFDYSDGAVKRLEAFQAVLGKIVKVNEALQKGLGSVRGVKAAQAIVSIYYGMPLKAFTGKKGTGWATPQFIETVFKADPNFQRSLPKNLGPASGDPNLRGEMGNVYGDPMFTITKDLDIDFLKTTTIGETVYQRGDKFEGQNDPAVIDKLYKDKSIDLEDYNFLNNLRKDVMGDNKNKGEKI